MSKYSLCFEGEAMLGFVIYFVELIICFLLQNTVLSSFNIGGIVPDLIVILIVSVAYQRGRIHGMFMGIVGGLLLDITFGSLFGVYALAYMFIGYVCGMFNKYYIRFDTMLPLSMIALSEFAFSLYSYLVNLLIIGRFDIGYYIRRIMLPKVCFTVLAAIILYKLFDLVYMKVLMPIEEEA
jgi:rod shape-determining protein MreD